jgi:CHAD domain-containing protein
MLSYVREGLCSYKPAIIVLFLKDLINFTGMVTDTVRLKDIKPVLSGYISDSRAMLNPSSIPDDESVHDIRVLMKRSRAVIRLLANHLDEESCQREYSAYREAGRILGTWRDHSIHRKTLKSFKKETPEIFSAFAENVRINELLQKYEPPADVPQEVKADIEKINDILSKSAFRMRFYTLDKLDPQVLLKELEKSYKMAADTYLKCRNVSKPVLIHELRKKSKDFLYQLYFFRPLNPEAVKGLEKKLETLTSNLGKYNDLTHLLEAMDYKYDNPENSTELNELSVLIRNRQDQYLEKVWPQAFKIFCPGQKLVNLLGFKLLVI